MFFLHIVHYVSFAGAQAFNGVLLFFIVRRARKLFGNYGHVMLVFTLCSIMYSWVEIVTQPVLHMKGPMFVVFLDRTMFSDAVGEFIACLHCGTFGFLAAVLTSQFFYRYLALCKPSSLVHFEGKRLFLMFVPCLLVYVSWFEVVQWGMSATEEKRIYLKADLQELYEADSMRVPFIAPLYWNVDPHGNRIWRPEDVASSGVCVLIIMTLSSMILFFAFKIYFHMKSASVHMSSRTRELNRQLFLMLTVQTIVPFVTMYVPVGLLIALPLFDLSLGPYVNYPSASLAAYPMIEPLIAFFCIADFRKALLGLLRGNVPKVSDVSRR